MHPGNPHRPAARRTASGGFSLVELMVVILIIAILMGLTVSGARFALVKSWESKTRTQLEAIKLGLGKYKEENGEYPPSTGGSEELYKALTGDENLDGQLTDEERKKGVFLEELLAPGGSKSIQGWVDNTTGKLKIVDAFGEEIEYKQPGDENALYDLWSYGSDKKKKKENQAKWITNWN